MGWLSRSGKGEEEESHLSRLTVHAAVSTLPVDSPQAVPPLSFLPSCSTFAPRV